MKRFEYKNVRYVVPSGILSYQIKIMEVDALLNQYGQEGWELISTIPTRSNVTGGNVIELIYIFKREL